ncbi:hypothetical protein GQ53DRAFT_810621 [Thozetella sp. PMI_491]|nr:hypothetical protein GQ53DRAFT_810621 [Thozetella sp. PMI_491]
MSSRRPRRPPRPSATEGMASTAFKIVPHRLHTSRRIPETVWEEFRGEIIKQYTEKPLKRVMEHMEKALGFKATKRQYVHRLGVWGIRKYGKADRDESREASEPPTLGVVSAQPRLYDQLMMDAGGGSNEASQRVFAGSLPSSAPRTHQSSHARRVSADPGPVPKTSRTRPQRAVVVQPDVQFRERAKLYEADLMHTAGDKARAFPVYSAMHRHHLLQGARSPSFISRLAISCVVSVSTPEEAELAGEILENSMDWLRFPGTPHHALASAPASQHTPPEHFLVHLLLAYVWDGKAGEKIPLLQIDNIVDSLVSENGVLRELPRRRQEVHVDFLVLELLQYALVRARNGDRHGHLKIINILRQFVDQQRRSLAQGHEATAEKCLKGCLLWITGLLESKTSTMDDEMARLGLKASDDVDDALQLCCYLWYYMCVDPSPEWVDTVEPQLGMSPTQILYILATMIIAGVRREKYPTPPHLEADKVNLQAMVCEQARVLAQTHDSEFLDLFIDEACRLNPLLPSSPTTPDRSKARQGRETW